MDSLNIIGDINSRISSLDDKIQKTSKAASVAFSYLNTRIDKIYNEELEDIDKQISYLYDKEKSDIINIQNDHITVNSAISDIQNNITLTSSYVITLQDSNKNLSNTIVKLETNNETLSVSLNGVTDRIDNLEKQIDNINTELSAIIDKLDKISFIPQNYIIVSKEKPLIVKWYNNIKDFMYKVFHYRQIQRAIREAEEERIRKEKEIEEERKRRQEEEERKRKETLEKQKQEELKRKTNSYKKIKELLK